jgi:arylsulfatase A-like enzyme
MTGMNAARHRVTNWTLKKDVRTDAIDSIVQPPDWNFNGLNVEEGINNTVVATTLPHLLRQDGYATIHIGKAHFAAIGTPCANPVNCGFDINIAGHAAGAPGSYNGLTYFGNNADGSPKGNWSVPGLEKYHGKDINLTEALTLEAKSIIDTVVNRDQPFYLYMSHYTVHSPIQADHRFFQKYIDQGLDTIEARYASMVEGMDKSLGDLMDHLEDKGISDKTIILFM